MGEIMEALSVVMDDVCREVKKMNPDNKKEAIREWYEKRTDELAAETHAKYGLTREALQTAMTKFMEDPTFLRGFTKLQEQQTQRYGSVEQTRIRWRRRGGGRRQRGLHSQECNQEQRPPTQQSTAMVARLEQFRDPQRWSKRAVGKNGPSEERLVNATTARPLVQFSGVSSGGYQTDEANVPTLHKDQVVHILETLYTKMAVVMVQRVPLEAKIRTAWWLSEDEITLPLVDQVEAAILVVEDEVFATFKTSEREVQIATEYYEGLEEDKDVAKALKKLQGLYRSLTRTDIEIPADLTGETVISLLTDLMESLDVEMEELWRELQELNPPNKLEMCKQRYAELAEARSAELLAKHGITRDILQFAFI